MSVHDTNATWFVAQLKPNSIKIAERNLLRQGFRTFFPREQTTKRVRDRFVATEQPFFPGYIFIGLTPAKGGWRQINSTSGVTRLVCVGNEPAEVPSDLITQLMLRCDSAGKILPPERLKAGDQVHVTSGPFANFIAEVDSVAPDRRIWVLMDMMGAKTRIKIARENLQVTR